MGEAEGGATCEVGAGEGGAPVAFDVLDHELGSGEMADAWGAFWVVHGVGEVAEECHGFSLVDHLADGEGATEDAHVEVDATEDDVIDVPFGEKVPCLLSVVGEGLTGGDADFWMLAGPCFSDGAFFVGAGAAHVGIIDGEYGFVFGVGPEPAGAPAF